MKDGDAAWAELQAMWAADDAAHAAYERARRSRRRRRDAEDNVGEVERVPDLSFEFAEAPPRWTLQAARGVRVVKGRPLIFTKAKARAGAAKLEAMFRAALPAGWVPRTGAVRVEVFMVFPLRKGERLPSAEMLIPHTERPDLTNLWKGEEDALTRALVGAGAVFDDSQIYDLHLRKFRGRAPRWSVRMWWETGRGQGTLELL